MRVHPLMSSLCRAAAIALLVTVAGCGGGSVDAVVVVAPPPPPPIASLDIGLTRVGPEAIQVDWSDDPDAASFVVRRNGRTLAQVDALTLVDASVLFDGNYCYDVTGFDSAGVLVSASDLACITVVP